MNIPDRSLLLKIGCLVFFFLGMGTVARAAQMAALQYTYRPDHISVRILTDKTGKNYLPLMDAAKFYGIEVTFDAKTRKILLKKGNREVRAILSQPYFLLVTPQEASGPMDPIKFLSGELALPVESSGDLLGTALNVNARYLSDTQTLVVGGIKADEVRREILTQAESLTPTPPLKPVPTATPAMVSTDTPVPPAKSVSLTPTPQAPDEDATPAPIPGRDQLPPPKNVYRVRRIIIDPGHGGIDRGATGYDKRYTEKQATLYIAKRVTELLRQDKSLEVFMTRTTDHYITLKYRTTFANEHKADLFVSIHCNANPNTRAHGTETFVYSSKASNNVAEVAAARENGHTDFLDFIQNDLRHNAFRVRSYLLAEMVDERIRDRLGQHIRRIQQAPFYVLARVGMPSILIETAFITNPKEEKKLEDSAWRDRIAHAIADGILAYKDKVEGSFEPENNDQ
ncbi:MAG: N-acetylmuramoyl-L-alanine amidase [bacterium]